MMNELKKKQTTQDSRLLYKLCCDVGFSPKQWQRRLMISDLRNTLESCFGILVQYAFLHSGSSSEGVGMDYLGSDIDIMHIILGTSVTEGKNVPEDETDHMFQLLPTRRPAFVNADLLSVGMPEENTLDTTLFLEPGPDGRRLLNGDKMRKDMIDRDSVRHGPALTSTLSETMEIDHVLSLHCRSWPSASEEWIHRERSFNWPSTDLIHQIVHDGCELVNVASAMSKTPHIEWRLSSSMAEKRLVREFNMYQIQCYFLLKMILKFRIKPLIEDKLVSYHMKMVMLHVIENTDAGIWRKDNLADCFMICLRTLHRCLKYGYLPQYFIPQQNLFHPKIQGETRQQLLKIVSDLVSEGWMCLLKCEPFHSHCAHQEPRCVCHIRIWEEQCQESKDLDVYGISTSFFTVMNKILARLGETLTDCLHSLLRLTHILSEENPIYFPCRETVRALENNLEMTLGLVFLSLQSFCKEKEQKNLILYFAWQAAEEGSDTTMVPCQLKYATFLYKVGDIEQCIGVVQRSIAKYEEDSIADCADTERVNEVDTQPEYRQKLFLLLEMCADIESSLSHFVYPVVFSKWEMKSCPAGIKDVAKARDMRTEDDRSFSSLLFIDSVVYAHFLLVICFWDIGKPTESGQSLGILRRYVQNPSENFVFYPEIANLLYRYCQKYRRQ